MSPFTGCKKRKASNKTREKYMPEERDKIQPKQTGDHFTMVVKVMMIMRIIMKIWKQSFADVLKKNCF